jgi:hypothetical protein
LALTGDLELPEGSFELRNGMPRPRWDLIAVVLEARGIEDADDVWTEATRRWLLRLEEHLGGAYRVYESERFLLLSPHGDRASELLIRLAERTLTTVLTGLPDLFGRPALGKLACLAFASHDAYYEYISDYYPEGSFGASGGLFVHSDRAHMVLNKAPLDSLESTLVHELTHACLEKRGLPLWIEEGITQLMEEEVLGSASRLPLTRDQARRHVRYWRRHGLGIFWQGEAFHRPDRGQALSYELALILVRNLLERGRESFLRFIGLVEERDCGAAASLEVYGVPLGAWPAAFLGPGDWSPEAPGESADPGPG